MDSLIVCIDSLLKFNNVLDCLILYPNKLTGEEESYAIKLQKIINKNSENIDNQVNSKIKNFKNYSKEEQAFLLIFCAELNYSELFDITKWNNLLERDEFKVDIEKLNKDFSKLLN